MLILHGILSLKKLSISTPVDSFICTIISFFIYIIIKYDRFMGIRLEKIELMPGESFRVLRWTNNVHDVEIVGPTGIVSPYEGAGDAWHHHPEMELTLVTHGRGTRFVGDAITTFNAPDLVLIGGNVPHYWHGLHHSSGHAIQFSFEDDHPFWRMDETRELHTLWSNARYGIQFISGSAEKAAGMIEDIQSHTGVERLSLFISVLATLARASAEEHNLLSGKMFIPSRRESTYNGIRTTITFILNNFHEEIGIEDVIKQAGMSRATFSRQFRHHTGKTFTRFLNEVRIDFACRQLIETDQSIGEIAFASGFNNMSHFNHQFSRLRNLSPRQFRHDMREKV